MRKILSILILMSLLVLPVVASAQVADSCRLRHNLAEPWNNNRCTLGANVNETSTKAWGMCCMLDAVYTATDWVFAALVVVVGLLVAWGGVNIATAGGAPEKVSTGRNYILYALIGLAVALLAKALPSLVEALLGV